MVYSIGRQGVQASEQGGLAPLPPVDVAVGIRIGNGVAVYRFLLGLPLINSHWSCVVAPRGAIVSTRGRSWPPVNIMMGI